MEQLNRVELRGMVGGVRKLNFNDRTGISFTLATNQAYRDHGGEAIIETTWHNIVAWQGKNIQDIDKVEKGKKLYVSGRIRNTKYSASDGTERNQTEIQASRLVLIDDSENLQYEM